MEFNPNPIIIINGHSWQKHPDIEVGPGGYMFDYYKIAEAARELELENKWDEVYALYNRIITEDLWFIVYFILGIGIANHPFIVRGAWEVQNGPETDTLDLWARGHFKTTTISIAKTIQDIVKDREERIGIFSYTKDAALKIFSPIRLVLETSNLLKRCFPDILYDDPIKQSPLWADKGITVKRRGFYREPTLAAYGLLTGMPTGDHLTTKVADDLVTEDIADSHDLMEKLKVAWEQFLNIKDASKNKLRIAGTIYDYDDLYVYLENQKDVETGEPLYHVRRRPATVDGTINGAPVFMSSRDLNKHKQNKKIFAMQYLLDPTPTELRKLESSLLKPVSRAELPKNLFKFMTIDPSGEKEKRNTKSDPWAIAVIGVEPVRDDVGNSNIYILDLLIQEMELDVAFKAVVDMYLRNGLIMKVGIEKVGQSTFQVHIPKALAARGKIVSKETDTLQILSPGGRSKASRIAGNLALPLLAGNVHYLDTVPSQEISRLIMEMDKFPYWHDDGLDAVSYVYDMIAHYTFSTREEEKEPDPWDEAFRMAEDETNNGPNAWMAG